ncbi:hypothetical protein ACFL10_00820 [Patescibacteria group bacterium]
MPRSKKEKSIDGPTKSKGSKEISLKEDKDFTVHHIEDEELEDFPEAPRVLTEEPQAVKKVVVSFDNFVNLVANHNYKEVVDKNKDEEVIVSSNLLADLANAHEQEEERRIPAIFIIGVVLGIVMTYILLTF